jgi:hypothetical protein
MHDEPGHPWTLEKLARRAGMCVCSPVSWRGEGVTRSSRF